MNPGVRFLFVKHLVATALAASTVKLLANFTTSLMVNCITGLHLRMLRLITPLYITKAKGILIVYRLIHAETDAVTRWFTRKIIPSVELNFNL